MLKLATIGTSTIAKCFMSAVALSDEFTHYAIYSRKHETGLEFGKISGCTNIFTDLCEMAQSDIDCVYIASPNRLHYEQSKLFLENGKHVICEKPITSNLAQYKELKALADSKNLIYMEAIMSTHSPSYASIHDALKELGNISMARIDFCQRSSRLDNFYKGIPQNIFDMNLHAGTLMDLGVYCVYAACDMFGMPESITATANYFDNGADCSGSAIFSYKGFPAVLSYAKNGQSKIGCEIIGDSGTLVIGSISQYINAVLIKNGEETVICPSIEKPEVMLGEVEAFAGFIKNNGGEDYDRISALCSKVHSCMDMIKASAGIKYPQ